jgi:hypothetical protein
VPAPSPHLVDCAQEISSARNPRTIPNCSIEQARRYPLTLDLVRPCSRAIPDIRGGAHQNQRDCASAGKTAAVSLLVVVTGPMASERGLSRHRAASDLAPRIEAPTRSPT